MKASELNEFIGTLDHVLGSSKTTPKNEASISGSEFRSALDALTPADFKGPTKDYSFKLRAITKYPDEFNQLESFLFDSHNQINHNIEQNIRARINSDRDEDDAYLWDAGITASRNGIAVDGSGGPGASDGFAQLLFGADGALQKIVRDNLKGKIIEEDEAELESIELWHVPVKLYDLIKSLFGPSA